MFIVLDGVREYLFTPNRSPVAGIVAASLRWILRIHCARMHVCMHVMLLILVRQPITTSHFIHELIEVHFARDARTSHVIRAACGWWPTFCLPLLLLRLCCNKPFRRRRSDAPMARLVVCERCTRNARQIVIGSSICQVHRRAALLAPRTRTAHINICLCDRARVSSARASVCIWVQGIMIAREKGYTTKRRIVRCSGLCLPIQARAPRG